MRKLLSVWMIGAFWGNLHGQGINVKSCSTYWDTSYTYSSGASLYQGLIPYFLDKNGNLKFFQSHGWIDRYNFGFQIYKERSPYSVNFRWDSGYVANIFPTGFFTLPVKPVLFYKGFYLVPVNAGFSYGGTLTYGYRSFWILVDTAFSGQPDGLKVVMPYNTNYGNPYVIGFTNYTSSFTTSLVPINNGKFIFLTGNNTDPNYGEKLDLWQLGIISTDTIGVTPKVECIYGFSLDTTLGQYVIMEQLLVKEHQWFAFGYYPGFWGSTGNSSIVIMVGDTSSCVPQITYEISIDTFGILNIGVPSSLDSSRFLIPLTIFYQKRRWDWLYNPAYIILDFDSMKIINSRYFPIVDSPYVISFATSRSLLQNKAALLISNPPSVLIVNNKGDIENTYQLNPLATDTVSPDSLIPFTEYISNYTVEYPTFPDMIDIRTEGNDIFVNLPYIAKSDNQTRALGYFAHLTLDNVSGTLTDACCEAVVSNYVADTLPATLSLPAPIIIRNTSTVEFFPDTAIVELNWQIESRKDQHICSAVLTSVELLGNNSQPIIYSLLDGTIIIENCEGCQEIRIVDMAGRTIYVNKQVFEGRIVIPYRLPEGLYIIVVRNKKGMARAKITLY